MTTLTLELPPEAYRRLHAPTLDTLSRYGNGGRMT
jgi:hypothetical protein